jgi:hypothetical protein
MSRQLQRVRPPSGELVVRGTARARLAVEPRALSRTGAAAQRERSADLHVRGERDMGNTIWLQIKRGGKVTGGERDNSIMLRLEHELDALADEIAVARPSSFRAWHDPAVGLEAVSALVHALRENPQRLQHSSDPSREHWPDLLLQELSYCEGTLKSAAEEGCRFRFRVVA